MVAALVFGTGSIGSVYGYILHKAGAAVTVVCRSNFSDVGEKGITIRSALWGDVHYRPHVVKTIFDASERQENDFDYVFVCTKSFPGNAHHIQDAVGPNTTIVLAQNGLGIEAEYCELYPDNTIISGVVFVPAQQKTPAVIDMGPVEKFDIGTFPATASTHHKARVAELAELWKQGGGNATIHDDIQGARWKKLCLNATFNPLCALTRVDTANFLISSPDADDLIVHIIGELGQVATSFGYGEYFTEAGVESVLAYHRGRKETGAKDPSMLMDVKAGRAIEIESIIGNVLRMAKGKNIKVPRLEMLYVLLRALEFGREQPEGRWKEPIP